MRKIGSALALLIVGLLLVSFIAVPVKATPTSPTPWEVGDKWAMGKEVDFGKEITAQKNNISTMLDALANLSLDRFTVKGEACYYVLFEVTGETSSTYTVQAKVAFKFDSQWDVSVSGKLPKAGTYGYYDSPFDPDSSVNKESKTVSVKATEKLGVVVTTTAIVAKGSLAVSNMTVDTNAALTLEVDAKNIPQINSSGTQQVLAYKNYDMGVKATVDVVMYMDLAPSLDLFQTPVVPGETWYTNVSSLTMNGYVTGTIDAHGLEDDWKENIFTDDLFNATGASDFPIDLSKLNSEESKITNGHFGPVNVDIPSIKMKCLTTTVTYTVGGVSKEYYVIEVEDSQRILYSPTLGFVGGAVLSTDLDNLPVDLPSGSEMVTSMMGDELSMDPMSTDTVAKEIASIETYTNNVAGAASGDGSIGDFFFKSPYLGTLMIIGAAACLGIILYVGTRAKKAAP